MHITPRVPAQPGDAAHLVPPVLPIATIVGSPRRAQMPQTQDSDDGMHLPKKVVPARCEGRCASAQGEVKRLTPKGACSPEAARKDAPLAQHCELGCAPGVNGHRSLRAAQRPKSQHAGRCSSKASVANLKSKARTSWTRRCLCRQPGRRRSTARPAAGGARRSQCPPAAAGLRCRPGRRPASARPAARSGPGSWRRTAPARRRPAWRPARWPPCRSSGRCSAQRRRPG